MVLSSKLALFNKRYLNRAMMLVAPRVPGFAVLHHRGRRSGRRYSIPINVFVRGDRYVFAPTYGLETDWLKNVLASNRCTITTRGQVVPLQSPRVYRNERRTEMPPIPRWFLGRLRVDSFLEMWTSPRA